MSLFTKEDSFPKIIFVGMNPSNAPVTENSAWSRFMLWIRELEDRGTILEQFSFTNVSLDPYWNGKKLTEEEQNLLKMQVNGYDVVVSLGGKAYDELKKVGVESFKMPHPSPRNRLLNDSEYEDEMLDKLESYILEIQEAYSNSSQESANEL